MKAGFLVLVFAIFFCFSASDCAAEYHEMGAEDLVIGSDVVVVATLKGKEQIGQSFDYKNLIQIQEVLKGNVSVEQQLTVIIDEDYTGGAVLPSQGSFVVFLIRQGEYYFCTNHGEGVWPIDQSGALGGIAPIEKDELVKIIASTAGTPRPIFTPAEPAF